MSIHHDASLAMDQRILFDLVLPRYTLKNIIGRVMRAQEIAPPSSHARVAGVEFSAIREKDREQVIRYIFERQIALKKKA
jgi:c-di-GMP-binding flagellar brake protein YcgR